MTEPMPPNLNSDPHPNADEPPREWRPADHDPDPRKWGDGEIAAGLNTLPIPECTLRVHRANRHDRTSDVQALTLDCAGALTFEAITQIAGLFETPHITFAPRVRKLGDCDGNMCEECTEPFTEIVVRWDVPPAVSKIVNRLPYATPIDGSAPACILPPDGKTAREILAESGRDNAHDAPGDRGIDLMRRNY